MVRTIGILGAGKVGIVLAQLAVKAGFDVVLSGSGAPSKIELSVSVLVPGAKVATNDQAVEQSDLVILALPLSKFKTIPVSHMKDKLVIDAMNHWWEVDGPRSNIIDDSQSSSEAVQIFLESARVVKAFSHMGYHELHDETRPTGHPDRKAIALAGNNPADIRTVSEVVSALGFDPLHIGDLTQGAFLEPGNAAFGANLSIEELKTVINTDKRMHKPRYNV